MDSAESVLCAKVSSGMPRYPMLFLAIIANSAPGPNGCIEWQRKRNPLGYATWSRFRRIAGNSYRVSRIMIASIYGSIPRELCVLHECDNPTCINPDHLFLGTQKHNAQDREAKGRSPDRRGEGGGRSILKTHQVVEIKKLLASGRQQKQIADLFGVSPGAIHSIARGVNWSHVK
jgi:hypothetical protein